MLMMMLRCITIIATHLLSMAHIRSSALFPPNEPLVLDRSERRQGRVKALLMVGVDQQMMHLLLLLLGVMRIICVHGLGEWQEPRVETRAGSSAGGEDNSGGGGIDESGRDWVLPWREGAGAEPALVMARMAEGRAVARAGGQMNAVAVEEKQSASRERAFEGRRLRGGSRKGVAAPASADASDLVLEVRSTVFQVLQLWRDQTGVNNVERWGNNWEQLGDTTSTDSSALQRASLGMFGNSVHLLRPNASTLNQTLADAYNLLQSVLAHFLATIALSKYDHHRTYLFQASGGLAQEHINDIAAYDVIIMYYIFVATLICAEFLFPLFWPTRGYEKWWRLQAVVYELAITKGVKR
ncbi:hypothetical protein BDQ17DRAFT_1330303 [Cyathus striatus]|nr:hypothetical protein BDQ17DRAFT_1330303 [Cyathus striatus]